MAKGFTKVDNEILEALINAEINATELKVLLTIIRYTKGYNREECTLAVDYITKLSGKSRSSVLTALKKLCNIGFIFKNKKEKTKILSYGLNFNYIKLHCNGVENCTVMVQETEPISVQKTAHYKDNIINKNNKYNYKQNDFYAKPTSFSNFTPTHNIDYDKLERDALKKKLELCRK